MIRRQGTIILHGAASMSFIREWLAALNKPIKRDCRYVSIANLRETISQNSLYTPGQGNFMRIVDKKLCESYRGKPCAVCKWTIGSVGHHIKSKGSGGHDMAFNLMPLCHEHHRMIHDKGLPSVSAQYSEVREFLVTHGWELDSFTGKWWHEGLNKC